MKTDDKVMKLIERFNFNSDNKYLAEALYVAEYKTEIQEETINNKQMKCINHPNRTLALIGDRVLKLVLTIEGNKKDKKVEKINLFINKYETDKHLSSLKIIDKSYGYSTEDNKIVDNKKYDRKTIATMIEAIIGSLFKFEYESKGTFNTAYEFIVEYIINNKG